MAEAKKGDSQGKAKGKVKFQVSENVGLDTIKLTRKLSEEAIKDHGCFRIAVSGGSFSKHFGNGLKELIQLKQNDIDLSKWKVFFADERCVMNDDDDSNFKGFKTQFMSNAQDIKPENVFPIDDKIIQNSKKQGDESKKNDDNQADVMAKVTEQICESYGKDILGEFGIKETDKNVIPQFDCIYLGMGPDGHTASLFPGHKLLQSPSNIVDFIVDSPKPPPFRITLALSLICNAKNIVFVVTGSSKQDAMEQITGILQSKDENTEQSLPAGIVTQNATGNVIWVLDEQAAKTAKL
eukprot:12076_1